MSEKNNGNDEVTKAVTKSSTSQVTCHGCRQEFPSRNAMFRHLRETNGRCLNATDYEHFLQYVQSKETTKILVLYGYMPSTDCLVWNYNSPANSTLKSRSETVKIENGDDAARLVWQVVVQTANTANGERAEALPPKEIKVNRSYGHTSRATDIVAQDDGTGAVSEVLMCKVPKSSLTSETDDEWLARVNDELHNKLESKSKVRILGRLEMPQRKFNAEMDVSHRKVEYMLPADFLYHNDKTDPSNFASFLDSLPAFSGDSANPFDKDSRDGLNGTLDYLYKLKKIMQSLTTRIEKLDTTNEAAVLEKSFHLEKRKALKQNRPKRQRRQAQDNEHESISSVNRKKHDQEKNNNKENKVDNETKRAMTTWNRKNSLKGKNVLRRRRFHNFTPRVLAHEFLAYRRLDRFHVATIRYDSFQHVNSTPLPTTNGDCENHAKRPFLVLSLSGDLFLNGQAPRVVGLFLALARGVISQDMVECMFDEEYPHLVPAPPVPSLGLYAREASYSPWEGKCQAILSPRAGKWYDKGWNSEATLRRVADWQSELQGDIVQAWFRHGICSNTGRLVAEQQWSENVLEPWARTAEDQLQHYREWKKSLTKNVSNDGKRDLPPAANKLAHAVGTDAASSHSSPLSTVKIPLVDNAVPAIYANVLQLLREANASGLWPSTTPKRQLVMVSSATNQHNGEGCENKQPASLSMAHMIAKSSKNSTNPSSAYSSAEGQGGASGSFSVGYMPTEFGNSVPKANTVFPDLVQAAFELEVALFPNREPSSTIAINRNAQFRPHTDSGAGAGQSISLIVGMGDYSGGELMVECEMRDIRYKPVEFNGWKQRHWTMPFEGERYSLVWFTPKGCEGVHGINLSK